MRREDAVSFRDATEAFSRHKVSKPVVPQMSQIAEAPELAGQEGPQKGVRITPATRLRRAAQLVAGSLVGAKSERESLKRVPSPPVTPELRRRYSARSKQPVSYREPSLVTKMRRS